jgi:hypothetical protein
VTGVKPIAVWSQSISGVSKINPLVAFYDIHGRKRGSVLDTSRNDVSIAPLVLKRPNLK